MADFGVGLIILSLFVSLLTAAVKWIGFIKAYWPITWISLLVAVFGVLVVYLSKYSKTQQALDEYERTKRKVDIDKLYEYEEVRLAKPKNVFFWEEYHFMAPGADLSLVQEPDNNYDQNAIRVEYEGRLIGYLFKGELQRMVNDFINRGDMVIAELETADDRNVYITITLGKYQ